MAAVTTMVLVGVGVAAAGIGAYAAVKQGQVQNAMAKQQASEMELQTEAMKTQRSGEKVDESSQQLERARQLDQLFREQRVNAASTGLMGESFSAIQASDLSAYSREQAMSSLYSSAKDSNASLQLESMRRQIASTRASGAFAQKMGILNATGGILNTASGMGWGMKNNKII